MARRAAPVLIAAIVTVASACGGGTDESTAPPAEAPAVSVAADDAPAPDTATSAEQQAVEPQPASSAQAEPSAVPVPEILQFSTVDLTGTAVDGASFAGRPVAFWFWAPT